MSWKAKSKSADTVALEDPTFPPLLTGFPVEDPLSPFEEAVKGAIDDRRFGAGDTLWSDAQDKASWAIVLEPEVPLSAAQQMTALAMVAIGDCLGALTPPQVAVTFRWPNIILVNGGVVGHVRSAVDGNASPGDTPDWMVIGIEIKLRHPAQAPEPGERPDETALAEEGAGDLDRTTAIESNCRHFLTWLNIWQESGFKSIADAWLFRAEGRDEDISLQHRGEQLTGRILGLDENADTLFKKTDGKVELLAILDHFERHGLKEPQP